MAKLFLSYAREDREVIEPIAHLLEQAGHSVWWDRRIFGGSDFSLEIARELDSADVVVVGWSAASTTSHWVKDEAAEGRNRNRLVPLLLDGTPPPLGFRQIHGIDFGGWNGRGTPASLDELLRSIDLVAGSGELAPAPKPVGSAPRTHPFARPGRHRTILVLGAAAVLLTSAALGVLVMRGPSSADAPPRETLADTRPAPAIPHASSAKAGDPGSIDGRWQISWTINGNPYRGTLEAEGADARIALDVPTSMGRQSVRQDCTVAGDAPVQVTCHNAEIVSGPPGYMPDSFTFERRGNELSGTISDPLGLVSAPVTARRE